MQDLLIESMPMSFRTELREGSDGTKKIFIRGQFARSDKATENKRLYREHLWKREIGRLAEDMRSRRVFGEVDHPCLTSDDFRVLTVDGWKPFREIKIGDKVWSRKGGVAVLSKVEAITDEPFDGIAYRVRGQSLDSGFTPNHKFLTVYRPDEDGADGREVYATIKEIAENPATYGHSVIPRTATWFSESVQEFRVPGVTPRGRSAKDVTQDLVLDAKLFAAFMGLYLSEGHCSSDSSDNYDVGISQKTEWSRKFMRDEVLSKLSPDLKWRETAAGFAASDQRLYHYLKPLGDAYTKRVPAEVKRLGIDALKELIFWFTMGDGRLVETKRGASGSSGVPPYGRQDVFSVSPGLIDDLHECLLRTGGCGSVQRIDPVDDYEFAGHTIRAEDKVPLYQLHVGNAKQIWLDRRWLRIDEFRHQGNVFCLTTTHGNFYMEQRGHPFWTGNSDGRTKLTRVSHLLTKLEVNGNEVIGEAEILDTPNGRIMKALAEAGAQIGVSSRGYGSTKSLPDGTQEVLEDFRLDTFDFVADPATRTAYPAVFREERERIQEAEVNLTVERLRSDYPGLVEALSKEIMPEGRQTDVARAVTEAEQRAEKRLTERFSVELRRGIEVLEGEVRASVRSELMSDPVVAGAKQVVEQIVELVRGYGIDPEAHGQIEAAVAECDEMRQRLGERELEVQRAEAERDEARGLAREAAYRLHFEMIVGADPRRSVIESLVGDVTKLESKESIDGRVAAIQAELKRHGVAGQPKEEPDPEAEILKAEAEEFRARVAKLEDENERLRKERADAGSRADHAEARLSRATEELAGARLEASVEKAVSAVGGGRGMKLRRLLESATSADQVEKLVESFDDDSPSDDEEAARIRARVGRGMQRDLHVDTFGKRGPALQSGAPRPNGVGNQLVEGIIGQKSDFDRLAGGSVRKS